MADLNAYIVSPTDSPLFSQSLSADGGEGRQREKSDTGNDNVNTDLADISAEAKEITIDDLYQFQEYLNFRLANLESLVSIYYPPNVTQNATQLADASSRLKLRDLDHICLPFFCSQPNPTSVQLNRLVSQLETTLSEYGRKTLLSNVRKWFRKRRDDNGQKVFAACSEIIPGKLKSGVQTEAIREDIRAHGEIYEQITELSAVEITDTESLHTFLSEKIKSFLDRRVNRRSSD